MLTKICGHCGKRIAINERCDCQKDRHKDYDRSGRNKDAAAIYNSKMWRLLTAECKAKCHGLDLYALHVKHKIVKGTLSHHITEVAADGAKIYSQDNLIYLSDKSHAEVHRSYDKSPESKKAMQKLLLSLLPRGGGG